MVRQGIVLGHVISERGIEVDKDKVETVEQLPPPMDVKSLRSFLGHAGFYRRFIKDFSKITKPLTHLLQKDVSFDFDEKCLAAFRTLKNALVSAPIIQPPDWSQPFEIMCDASDYAVGAVLGQRKEGRVHAVYYDSKTLSGAQLNYATTEKELLAVVFPFEKFRSYCKTPDFHRKSESLYHRDSPWISGYRAQNVSRINTQSHTSHHIKLIVHEFITSPIWNTSIQASWLNQSENSTQR
jgi:hypothetical protein